MFDQKYLYFHSRVIADDGEVLVAEERSVTLNSGLTEMTNDGVIQWRFGSENTLIAEINKQANSMTVFDDVLDGRFRDGLKLDNQTGSLTITNTTMKHAGRYELQINGVIKPFNLTVVKEISVMEGDSVTLNTGRTEMDYNEIHWNFGLTNTCIAEIIKCFERFSTFDVLDGRFRNRLKLDHQTGSLTITNTRSTHSGLYGVEIIRNRTVTTYRFNVTVSGVFADSDAVQSVSVMEGDSVSLQTNSELQTEDEITWTFGHSETRIADINTKHRIFSTFDVLDGRFRNRLKLDHQTGSLIITNSRTTDSGLYQVTIISSMRQITNRFNLTVSGLFADSVKSVSVMEGDSVTSQMVANEFVECVHTSSSLPTVLCSVE
ncbi:uncharacterized protein LOC107662818 [Sinocyclocheilus anshuiensis]|uniref:uncharacterized protein LOC107662818 n=1 Tax=Sinocyclocheilus anshuiensis TaxID=1608454 RepID=UPI0007B83C90|nr:PREDICTED: uncharacterized protein LOC107662818 [Sinocyclocheilus anshuiensis]